MDNPTLLLSCVTRRTNTFSHVSLDEDHSPAQLTATQRTVRLAARSFSVTGRGSTGGETSSNMPLHVAVHTCADLTCLLRPRCQSLRQTLQCSLLAYMIVDLAIPHLAGFCTCSFIPLIFYPSPDYCQIFFYLLSSCHNSSEKPRQ